MELSARLAAVEEVALWRDLYRQEMNCQIIHDSIHSRPGWSLEYFLNANGAPVGYGSVAVAGPWKDKPTLCEFYVLPHARSRLFDLFYLLLATSQANRIETQSNDPLLTVMLHAVSRDVSSESILFHDKLVTALAPAGAVFRRATSEDGLEITGRATPLARSRGGRGNGCGQGRNTFSLQPSLRRRLYGGRRAVSEARSWVLPGSRAEASVLRAWEHSIGPMQRE